MSESTPEGQPPRHDPLAALKQRNFRLYLASRVLSGTGQTYLQAVIAWQVYDITGSPLSLGVLGVVRFLPSLIMSFVGGVAADTYNRRTIMFLGSIVPLTCAVILSVSTTSDWVSLALILGLVLLMGLASSFESPARQAILAAIVREETFANAVTVNATVQRMGQMSGPLIGGLAIAAAGVASAYAVYCGFIVLSLVPLAMIHYKPTPLARRQGSLQAVKEGIQFVRSRQVILGAMLLDLLAVIFGGAQALLPVYASDILKVGPGEYGLLYASIQIGAFASSFVLAVRPPVVRAGRAFVISAVIFGLFTILFGFSQVFELSIAIYMLIGAADQVSFVMRQTIYQLATPDNLRGRVSAVGQVFAGASNQIGAMESGIVAQFAGAVFAVVSGGAIAMVLAAFIGWRLRELYAYRVPGHEVAETTASAEQSAASEPAAAGGGS